MQTVTAGLYPVAVICPPTIGTSYLLQPSLNPRIISEETLISGEIIVSTTAKGLPPMAYTSLTLARIAARPAR